jgi:hypothetical protein
MNLVENFFGAHPYLTATLGLLAVFVLGLLFARCERRQVLLSALLFTPAAFFCFSFVPEYWQPWCLGNLKPGVEDYLFCFSVGGIAWFFATLPVQPEIQLSSGIRAIVLRCGIMAFIASSAFIALRMAGIRAMPAALVPMAAVSLALGVRYRRLWKLAAGGAIGFGLLYTAMLAVALVVWPDLRPYWDDGNLWGAAFLGVPLEEIAWASLFGAAWPLVLCYIWGVGYSKPSQDLASSRLSKTSVSHGE